MGFHEQLPHDSPIHAAAALERKPQPELLPIDDNRVQLALMRAWNEAKPEEERIPHSELARLWIEEGYAERFRAYTDAHEGEKVDVRDKDALDEMLSGLSIETLH